MTIIHIASCSKGYGFDPDDLIQFEKKMCVCTLPLRLDIRGLYHYISSSDTSIITFLPFEHYYLRVHIFLVPRWHHLNYYLCSGNDQVPRWYHLNYYLCSGNDQPIHEGNAAVLALCLIVFSCLVFLALCLWPSQDSVRAVPACRRCNLCTLDRKLRLTTKMFNPVNKRHIEVFFIKGSKHSFISSFVYIGWRSCSCKIRIELVKNFMMN